MKKLILASASPRRKEIFEKLGLDFSVKASDKEPEISQNVSAIDMAFESAKAKATDVFSKNSKAVVVGADTVVCLNDKKLGKPKNEQDAFNMLKILSGNIHEVVTAVYVCSQKFSGGFTSTTQVEFYNLSDNEIWDYVKTRDCMDKAGGYGIQSKGITLVKGINGDYYNVVGFPAAEFVRFMEKNGL